MITLQNFRSVENSSAVYGTQMLYPHCPNIGLEFYCGAVRGLCPVVLEILELIGANDLSGRASLRKYSFVPEIYLLSSRKIVQGR